MRLVRLEWNRQAELNKQDALAVTDRWKAGLFVMKTVGQPSMLSFLPMFVFFSTAETPILCYFLSRDRNKIKDSAGKFSPDSLHNTPLTLLSPRRYI